MAQLAKDDTAAAKRFRLRTRTSGIENTLHRAVDALETQGIPSLVIGDLANQQYGVFWVTTCVELAVRDAAAAYECLRSQGFLPSSDSEHVLVDGQLGYEIRLIEPPRPN